MTPADRARQIDQQEFAAECHATRQRAVAYAEKRRGDERARIADWLGREAPAVQFNPSLFPAPQLALKPKPKARQTSERYGGHHSIDGLSLTKAEWADHLGITYTALAQRIRRFRTLEAAIAMGGPQRSGPKPGVVSNLPASEGTGGGSTAQESPEITFSEKAEIA